MLLRKTSQTLHVGRMLTLQFSLVKRELLTFFLLAFIDHTVNTHSLLAMGTLCCSKTHLLIQQFKSLNKEFIYCWLQAFRIASFIQHLLLQVYVLYFLFIYLKYIYSLNFMDDKISTQRMVNTWGSTDKIQRSILLIGPSHSGRTTYAQLLKKYRFGNPSQNLTFDAKGNYNLEGVISTKSIKIQTVYPGVYGKDKNNKQQVKAIDVPSIIFAPQSKKWTAHQQKITLQYLIAKNTKVGFLIFVEQKYTRANITPWKKAIMNFLDLFKAEALSQDIFNSVALFITKTPPQLKQDIMINRLKSMKAALQKEKGVNLQLVDKLFKYIIDENRVFIFKKATADEVQKESIITNWAQIEKISNYTINKQDFKEIPWPQQSQKSINQYFRSTATCLSYLSKATIQSVQNFGTEQIQSKKQPYPEIVNNQIQINELVKKRLLNKNDKQGENKYLNFINKYVNLTQKFDEVTPDNLEELIEEIAKFGFFAGIKDQRIFQLIFEGLQFKDIFDLKQFDITEHINDFKEIFSDKIKQSVLKKLIQAESGNQSKEFYENAISLMQKQFPNGLPASLKQDQKTFKKKMIKYSNPDQALKIYFKDLDQEKNQDKIFELGNDIGLILNKKSKTVEAARVYKNVKNIKDALNCYKEAATKDQKYIGQYTSYLMDLSLFEEALRFCYESFSRLGFGSKAKLSDNINQIILRKNDPKGVKNVLMGEIQGSMINEIKKITKQVIESL